MNNQPIFIPFSSNAVPEPIEKQDRNSKVIFWGEKNTYPSFLIKLLYDSAYQSGIIDGKVKYMTSAGYDVKHATQEDAVKFVSFENNRLTDYNLKAFIRQIALDLELFNGIAIKIVRTNGGKLAYYERVPLENIRTNAEQTIYYYSENWGAREQNEETGYQEYPPFNPKGDEGVSIIYFAYPSKNYALDARNKVTNIYPTPNYVGGVKDILSDIEISAYHYFELKNNFKAGSLITFTSGEPAEEERQQIEKDYKEGLTPTEKSGGIMINFVNGQEEIPNIQNLNGNDLDKRYLLTEEAVRKKIFVAHGVTTPALFGIATQGSLGSKQELEVAFEIFKKTYIRDRQEVLQTLVNYMLAAFGIGCKIELKEPETPFTTESQEVDNTLSKFKVESEIDSFIALASSLGRTEEELNGRIIGKEKVVRSHEEAARIAKENQELFKKQAFDLSEQEVTFLGLVNEGYDLARIAQAMKLTSTALGRLLNKLVEDGLLTSAGVLTQRGQVVAELASNADELEIEDVYKYKTIPGIPKAKSGSRPFCTALLAINRFYTIEEINQLDTLAPEGEAFSFRGGWYTNPETGETGKGCRHDWYSVPTLKRK